MSETRYLIRFCGGFFEFIQIIILVDKRLVAHKGQEQNRRVFTISSVLDKLQ